MERRRYKKMVKHYVSIDNFRMPKNCGKCPFQIEMFGLICLIDKRRREDYEYLTIKRPNDCPLRPIEELTWEEIEEYIED